MDGNETRQREEFRRILFELAKSQEELQDASCRSRMYKRLEALYDTPSPKQRFRHFYSDITERRYARQKGPGFFTSLQIRTYYLCNKHFLFPQRREFFMQNNLEHKIKKVLDEQEKTAMRLQNKQDIQMNRLEVKHAREKLDILNKAFHQEIETALVNGMTPKTAEAIVAIQEEIDTTTGYYNDCLEMMEALQMDKASFSETVKDALSRSGNKIVRGLGDLNESRKDFSSSAKEYLNAATADIKRSFAEKRNAGLATLSGIKDRVKDFNEHIAQHGRIGRSALYDRCKVCLEDCHTIQRSFLKTSIHADLKLMDALKETKEKMQMTADRGRSIAGRLRNAARALSGKEFMELQPKEYKTLEKTFSSIMGAVSDNMQKTREVYHQSLRASVKEYHKSADLRAEAGIEDAEETPAMKKRQHNLHRDLGRSSVLDRKIKQAEEQFANMKDKEVERENDLAPGKEKQPVRGEELAV